MNPEQAIFLRNDVFLPSLNNEHRVTKSVIAAIPGDGSYKPDAVSKSALELGWHIAMVEMRFLEAVAAGAFDLSPRPLPDTIKTGADLAAWYAENFAPRVAAVQALTADQLMTIVDFRGMFQLPAVMYLSFVIHHSIHHRGQLSVYLRPAGGKVPAIYGESYDSAAARKAAQTNG
jgi:uncharacterized damage-inducible protein DinB